VIDAGRHIGEEGERDEDQQDAGKADGVAAREEKRERACRHREIIRVALLETERARRVAAEMLEGESAKDRRGSDDEH
jgi:hypothetical protein